MGMAFILAILCSFFHFIRRFWNQILICRSVRQSAWAISILRRRRSETLTALHSTALNTVLYHYTVLHYIVLHYTILYYTVLSYTVLHHTALHYTAM